MGILIASIRNKKMEFVISFLLTFFYILSVKSYYQFDYSKQNLLAGWYFKLFNISYYSTVITAGVERMFNIYDEGMRFGIFYILIVLNVIIINLLIYLLVIGIKSGINKILG